MNEQREGKRRGRPKPRKEASLTMRLTLKTRTALEEAAAAEGRSISEMAERWLDMAARGKADFEGRVGSGAMGEALLDAVAFAHALADDIAATNTAVVAVDPATDIGIRAALVAGIGRLIALTYPIRGHGSSTPDPQPFRDQLRLACEACQRELIRIMAAPDTPGDVEAFSALDQCVLGDFREGSVANLRAALARINALGDRDFQQSVKTATVALDKYERARGQELDALARWTARGRILAENMAITELRYRMRDEVLRLQAKLPGSPFVGGALHRIGQVSAESLAERERLLAERAAQLYPETNGQ